MFIFSSVQIYTHIFFNMSLCNETGTDQLVAYTVIIKRLIRNNSIYLPFGIDFFKFYFRVVIPSM